MNANELFQKGLNSLVEIWKNSDDPAKPFWQRRQFLVASGIALIVALIMWMTGKFPLPPPTSATAQNGLQFAGDLTADLLTFLALTPVLVLIGLITGNLNVDDAPATYQDAVRRVMSDSGEEVGYRGIFAYAGMGAIVALEYACVGFPLGLMLIVCGILVFVCSAFKRGKWMLGAGFVLVCLAISQVLGLVRGDESQMNPLYTLYDWPVADILWITTACQHGDVLFAEDLNKSALLGGMLVNLWFKDTGKYGTGWFSYLASGYVGLALLAISLEHGFIYTVLLRNFYELVHYLSVGTLKKNKKKYMPIN